MRPRAGWAFVVLALVMGAGTSVYRDVVPGARTVQGFTLFAVEAGGVREPVVHFDGRRWRSPCEDMRAAAPTRAAVTRDNAVVAIEATRDTPLFPVRELPRDAIHWEAAWRALTADVAADVTPDWVREVHIYAVQDRVASTAFVDMSLRPSVSDWRGFSITGWVALEDHSAHRLDARVERFGSYEDFLALDRIAPLGVVQDAVSGARIWVMRTTGPRPEEIRVVELASNVRELIRVPRGGC
jgi:hypothetical protein